MPKTREENIIPARTISLMDRKLTGKAWLDQLYIGLEKDNTAGNQFSWADDSTLSPASDINSVQR